MKKEYPEMYPNVELEDIKTGFRLRDVFIRPTVESVGDKDGTVARFGKGYYVVSSGENGDGQRMDAIVHDEMYSRIQAGEEVTIKSHLTVIDLRWAIFQAIRDVLTSNQSE